jgi:hypothetical protein
MSRRPTHRRQRGQILPLMALLSLVLFAFAALALDGGLRTSATARHSREHTSSTALSRPAR